MCRRPYKQERVRRRRDNIYTEKTKNWVYNKNKMKFTKHATDRIKERFGKGMFSKCEEDLHKKFRNMFYYHGDSIIIIGEIANYVITRDGVVITVMTKDEPQEKREPITKQTKKELEERFRKIPKVKSYTNTEFRSYPFEDLKERIKNYLTSPSS